MNFCTKCKLINDESRESSVAWTQQHITTIVVLDMWIPFAYYLCIRMHSKRMRFTYAYKCCKINTAVASRGCLMTLFTGANALIPYHGELDKAHADEEKHVKKNIAMAI